MLLLMLQAVFGDFDGAFVILARAVVRFPDMVVLPLGENGKEKDGNGKPQQQKDVPPFLAGRA